jgi:hypothetical protein
MDPLLILHIGQAGSQMIYMEERSVSRFTMMVIYLYYYFSYLLYKIHKNGIENYFHFSGQLNTNLFLFAIFLAQMTYN